MSKRQLCFITFVLTACLAVLPISACTSSQSPMTVSLTVSPAPVVGEPVNLHIEIFSQTAAPNTVLTVTLPAEVELVSGSLNWSGDIEAKQTTSVDLIIRVTQAGEWFVFAQAFHSSRPGTIYGFGGSQGVYLQSSADSGDVLEVHRTITPPPVIQYDPSLWTPTPTGEPQPTPLMTTAAP
jgi:hypothetical protein